MSKRKDIDLIRDIKEENGSKANALGRQKAPFVMRSAFSRQRICKC